MSSSNEVAEQCVEASFHELYLQWLERNEEQGNSRWLPADWQESTDWKGRAYRFDNGSIQATAVNLMLDLESAHNYLIERRFRISGKQQWNTPGFPLDAISKPIIRCNYKSFAFYGVCLMISGSCFILCALSMAEILGRPRKVNACNSRFQQLRPSLIQRIYLGFGECLREIGIFSSRIPGPERISSKRRSQAYLMSAEYLRFLHDWDISPSAGSAPGSMPASFSRDMGETLYFCDRNVVPSLPLIDRVKLILERILGGKVDWYPLSEPVRPCSAGHIRVIWKPSWSQRDLSIGIPLKLANNLRFNLVLQQDELASRTRSNNMEEDADSQTSEEQPQVPGQDNPPPDVVTPSSSSSSARKLQERYKDRGRTNISNPQATISSPRLSPRWVYWCVDKSWSERPITHLCPLNANDQSADDMTFCKLLLRQYNYIRGFKGKWLSWKTCVDVEFIRFSRVFTSSNEIARLGVGLPRPKVGLVASQASEASSSGTHEYEYSLITTEEIHMAIAAKQILALMHNPKDFYKTRSTLNLIPKKIDSPLSHEMGREGWGIHAVQGFSLFKFLAWMGSLLVLHIIFVSCWLAFIDQTDLQNAFVPVGFVVTVVGLAVGVPQVLGRA